MKTYIFKVRRLGHFIVTNVKTQEKASLLLYEKLKAIGCSEMFDEEVTVEVIMTKHNKVFRII